MKQRFARWLLEFLGWTLEGAKPQQERYVLIAAHHTSNWDFPLMLAFAAAFDIRVTWMGKHSLFFPPVGWIMRMMGGMPIIRDKNKNVVASMVDLFKQSSRLVLVVPTEGTRDRTEHWKSGFYHIARGADVPVILSYLDVGKKVGGIGPAIELTGDFRADMDRIREFYAGMQGFRPENIGVIRLREEDVEEVVDHDGTGPDEIERLAGNL